MTPLSPLLSRTVTYFAILATTITIPFASPARAGASEDAWDLVEDVVHLVDSHYLNGDTASPEWEQQRQALLSQTFSNEAQARAILARALEYLDDPYTYLLTPAEFGALQDGMRGDVADIGIRLVLGARGLPTVSAPPLLGSPAFFLGIMPGDAIVAVDGRSSEHWSSGETLRHIQGRENSTVTLTLLRAGERVEVELVRTHLALPSVSYTVQNYWDEHDIERQIGYIRLARFDELAIDDMQDAIADLEDRAVDGYVLDLRSNPGGLLEAGTAIAEMFLDGGTIVTLEDRDRVRRIVDRRDPLTDKPLALLVDGGSASSSEVLAGALRDADRATLVGTQTFGKGVVQTLYMLSDNSCLAITTASYRTPEGHNLHHNGLPPDIQVDFTDEDRAMLARMNGSPLSTDPQYSAAVAALFERSAPPGLANSDRHPLAEVEDTVGEFPERNSADTVEIAATETVLVPSD